MITATESPRPAVGHPGQRPIDRAQGAHPSANTARHRPAPAPGKRPRRGRPSAKAGILAVRSYCSERFNVHVDGTLPRRHEAVQRFCSSCTPVHARPAVSFDSAPMVKTSGESKHETEAMERIEHVAEASADRGLQGFKGKSVEKHCTAPSVPYFGALILTVAVPSLSLGRHDAILPAEQRMPQWWCRQRSSDRSARFLKVLHTCSREEDVPGVVHMAVMKPQEATAYRSVSFSTQQAPSLPPTTSFRGADRSNRQTSDRETTTVLKSRNTTCAAIAILRFNHSAAERRCDWRATTSCESEKTTLLSAALRVKGYVFGRIISATAKPRVSVGANDCSLLSPGSSHDPLFNMAGRVIE